MKSIVQSTTKGITLLETILSIAILTAILGGFSLLMIRVWKVHGFTVETGVASLTASRGVEAAVEQIRKARQADNGAYAIVLADDDEFTFYADYDDDGVTERVHYFLDNQKFKMGIREPNLSNVPPTYADGDELVQDVAAYIVNNTSGFTLFEYFAEDSNILEYADAEGAALTTPAAPGDVRMVKVLLHVNPHEGTVPEYIRIQSFVTVRNLSDYDNPG